MAVFAAKKYRSPSEQARFSKTISGKYAKLLHRHPTIVFGIPLIATIVLGSYVLSFATTLRYEQRDQKVKQISQKESLGIEQNRRKVDLREEYYRLAMDQDHLDNWEQKRMERLPGESQNVF